MSDEPKGKVDLTSILYVACGVPGIVLFLVVMFGLVNACPSMPA